MSERFVLDSFAVLALLARDSGSDEVARLLRLAQEEEIRVLMTWVNAGQVAYIVERRFGPERLQAAIATSPRWPCPGRTARSCHHY